MILTRLANAVRTQNWFTVLIEFSIVVAGVLVALQVDQWQTNQTNANQEKIYVARLLAEAQSVKTKAESYLSLHTQIRDSALELVQRIENPAYCVSDKVDATSRLSTFGDFPPPNFAFSSVNELITSGKMQLIRSDDLRLKATQIKDQKDFLFLQWERYMVTKRTTDRALYLQLGFTLTRDAYRSLGVEDKVLKGFTFKTLENLCGNRASISDIANVTYIQLIYVQYIEIFIVGLERYLADLEDYSALINQ